MPLPAGKSSKALLRDTPRDLNFIIRILSSTITIIPPSLDLAGGLSAGILYPPFLSVGGFVRLSMVPERWPARPAAVATELLFVVRRRHRCKPRMSPSR